MCVSERESVCGESLFILTTRPTRVLRAHLPDCPTPLPPSPSVKITASLALVFTTIIRLIRYTKHSITCNQAHRISYIAPIHRSSTSIIIHQS
jgi:hypothetical protein